MAIAFDAGSQGSAFASSVTFSHTVGSGTNRLLVVFVESPTSDSSRVSSVTYNGTGLTLYNSGPFGASGTYIWTYYMVAPPTGSANVVVTCNAGGDVGAIASSWTGVDQSTPISGNVSAVSSGSSPRSDSVTLSAGEMAVDAFGWASGTTGTPDGSQTQIGTVVPQGLYFVASYLSGASAMGWSWNGGFSGFVHLIVRLAPASGATADLAGAMTGSGVAAGAIIFAKKVTGTLRDRNGNPVANATGLSWAFFDARRPNGSMGAPVAAGTSGTTDGSGVFSFAIPNSNTAVGNRGLLIISSSDGTEADDSSEKGFIRRYVVSAG